MRIFDNTFRVLILVLHVSNHLVRVLNPHILARALLEVLTNQKAKVLRTRKAVAAFNTKKFNAISSKVTVRGKTLHTFLWFLITVVLPRVSNFKELTRKSLTHDKNSLSLGLSNLALFPQLSKESEQLPKELGITITFNLDPKDSNLLLLLSEYQIPVLIT